MSDTTDRLSAALADRYRIERELGAGGMATVYLAEDQMIVGCWLLIFDFGSVSGEAAAWNGPWVTDQQPTINNQQSTIGGVS